MNPTISNLTGELNLRRIDKYVVLSNLAYTMQMKDMKIENRITFKTG